MAGAGGRDGRRVRAGGDRHDRRAGRGRPWGVARVALRAPALDPRRVRGAQGGGPGVRARPAGHRGERSPAGHRRGRAAHHGPGHDPRHGPAQRHLRGPAPAPLALLRPHGRDAGAARGPGRRRGGPDVHGDQTAGERGHDPAGRPAPAGGDGGPGIRAVLPGRLPPPSPRGGVGPDGGAAPGRGRVRRALWRPVHAGPDGAAGQGGAGAREVRGPASGRSVRRGRRVLLDRR